MNVSHMWNFCSSVQQSLRGQSGLCCAQLHIHHWSGHSHSHSLHFTCSVAWCTATALTLKHHSLVGWNWSCGKCTLYTSPTTIHMCTGCLLHSQGLSPSDPPPPPPPHTHTHNHTTYTHLHHIAPVLQWIEFLQSALSPVVYIFPNHNYHQTLCTYTEVHCTLRSKKPVRHFDPSPQWTGLGPVFLEHCWVSAQCPMGTPNHGFAQGSLKVYSGTSSGGHWVWQCPIDMPWDVVLHILTSSELWFSGPELYLLVAQLFPKAGILMNGPWTCTYTADILECSGRIKVTE